MDCHKLVYLFLGFCVLCCTASRQHDSNEHTRSHVHHSTLPSHHKRTQEKYHSKLHKKEEMLGQDMMRINDAEFKLQSLVSPEFHQGNKALNSGKSFGGMEVNTLSPEQVDFVQSTSQWPKFSNPETQNKDASKTIYPEDPVLFPNEEKKQQSNNFNDNWITMGSNSFKPMGGAPFDEMPTEQMGSMSSMGNMNGMFGQTQQRSTPMDFDVKPGYTTTADAPIDDKMTSFSDLGGLKLENKNMAGRFEGPSKIPFSSLLNEGIMNRRGKPIGILGNILKASQEMPTGRVIKPSDRSEMWFNDAGPFSRRHNLEKSRHTNDASHNEKHSLKEHVKKVKNQKTTK